MPLRAEHAGRQYPPTPPYRVSAAKIAEFARAVGEGSATYSGPDATAPLTFVAVITTGAWELMFDDPELGLALRRIVHGDQRLEFQRPLRAGDEVTATLRIDSVRTRSSADIIGASMQIATTAGEPVCTARATFFHSHEHSGERPTAPGTAAGSVA